ncbi:MAG: site-specific integrase [Chryseobacterium sp.]|nr:MAG: site-specific integrase [Chryseobacterium sp.]
MASVKIYPRLDKSNKNGQVPIYLRLTKNRKSKYIALDVYINPKDWNEKTGKVRTGAKNAAQINSFISSKEAEAEAIALEMETRSKFVTSYDIKSRIIGRPPADFFEFMERRIKAQSEELSIGTIRRFKGILVKLKKFVKNDKLFFDEINVKLIRDFQQFLLEDLKNQNNTVHSNLKAIRKMICDAIDEELMPAGKNPFNKIKLKGQKTFREFLLDDELERMEILELEEGSILNHHRNLYVFSSYSGGIRISDLLMMRWKNFNGKHLYFQIRKSKEELSIKLPRKSLDILDFYRSYKQNVGGPDPESFIFPLIKLKPDEIDRLKVFNAISSATAFTNKSLRRLALLANIDKKISFHTARHSWAVRALQKGMRIEYVSKLMGHASVKHTEVYARILNVELDKAMNVFDKKERLKKAV